MTSAQIDALRILSTVDGDEVEGWKRKSQAEPFPRVNMLAVASLVRLGYAQRHMRDSRFWSPYRHDERYTITAEGTAALAVALGEQEPRP